MLQVFINILYFLSGLTSIINMACVLYQSIFMDGILKRNIYGLIASMLVFALVFVIDSVFYIAANLV